MLSGLAVWNLQHIKHTYYYFLALYPDRHYMQTVKIVGQAQICSINTIDINMKHPKDGSGKSSPPQAASARQKYQCLVAGSQL